MNGLTGKKMQKIFQTLVPESVYSDARNLVEYCCFRFLSKDASEVHPSLQVFLWMVYMKLCSLSVFFCKFIMGLSNMHLVNTLLIELVCRTLHSRG